MITIPDPGFLVGETVVVHRESETGRDPLNNPIVSVVTETVEGVLVAPGPRADVDGPIRPDGTEIKWTLHFPKGYTGSLRGASVSVRGQDPAPVVGDPQHFMEENTPTRWSMPVELGRVDG